MKKKPLHSNNVYSTADRFFIFSAMIIGNTQYYSMCSKTYKSKEEGKDQESILSSTTPGCLYLKLCHSKQTFKAPESRYHGADY